MDLLTKRFFRFFIIISLGLFLSPNGLAEGEVNCPGGGKVCRISSTTLPLRVLPRPMSTLYSKPDTNANIIASNLKAFWPMYVFERKDVDLSEPAAVKGWYKVGTMVNDPWAWVQAKDVLEWKQALVVSYTHPGTGNERRHPVLMFKTKEGLDQLVDSELREEHAWEIYAGLSASPAQVPDEVISREPARFVNIEEKFYMLPVIDFEKVNLFIEETRYLQIAAALPGQRADEANPDTLESQSFMEQTGMMETVEGTEISTLGFDIKFVMDMTGSMGPYIDSTKKAIAKVAAMLSQKNVDAQVRYGLVGYRDDVKKVPAMRFTVKNFTEDLVDENVFQQVIASAEPAQTGSADYQEELFAGVKEALTSPWNENTIRFIIIVGDASSHEVGHPQNTSGLNAPELRELADTNKVSIISIHLKDPAARADHAIAEKQFSELASNPGTESPAYIPIAAKNHDEFERGVKEVTKALSEIITMARQGNVQQIIQNVPTAIPDTQDAGEKGEQMATALAAAALIDYLGKEATPPKDITAWVMDRDLTDPDKQALEVRVLLKKTELNDLIQALEIVQKALKRAMITQMEFFSALQGVVAMTTQDKDITFEGAKRVADAGLLPSWIESLPYKSEILEMSEEMFEGMSADERNQLEDSVDSKLELYRKINENSDLWIVLDERDASDDYVYPLPLSALP